MRLSRPTSKGAEEAGNTGLKIWLIWFIHDIIFATVSEQVTLTPLSNDIFNLCAFRSTAVLICVWLKVTQLKWMGFPLILCINSSMTHILMFHIIELFNQCYDYLTSQTVTSTSWTHLSLIFHTCVMEKMCLLRNVDNASGLWSLCVLVVWRLRLSSGPRHWKPLRLWHTHTHTQRCTSVPNLILALPQIHVGRLDRVWQCV